MSDAFDIFFEYMFKALVESTSVLVGIILGGIVGFFAGIAVLFIFWKWTQKLDWSFMGSKKERLFRGLFFIWVVITAIPGFCGCGSIIGGGMGAHRVVDKSDLIEKASITALSPLNEPMMSLLGADESGEVSLADLRSKVEGFEEDAAIAFREYLREQLSVVPESARGIIQYVVDWLAKKEVKELSGYGKDVVNHLARTSHTLFVETPRAPFCQGARRLFLPGCVSTHCPKKNRAERRQNGAQQVVAEKSMRSAG